MVLESSNRYIYSHIGDGLADYLIVHDGGAITSYRNNGNLNRNEEGSNWEGPEVISNGVGSEGRKLRFADMDGRLRFVLAWKISPMQLTNLYI